MTERAIDIGWGHYVPVDMIAFVLNPRGGDVANHVVRAINRRYRKVDEAYIPEGRAIPLVLRLGRRGSTGAVLVLKNDQIILTSLSTEQIAKRMNEDGPTAPVPTSRRGKKS